MTRRRLVLIVDILLLVVTLSLVLAACGPPKNPEVYQEGKQARRLADRLLADARDFISGFCGPAPLGMIVAGLSVALLRKRSA